EFSPSYPVVPSREYLERPPSCHPHSIRWLRDPSQSRSHGSCTVLLWKEGRVSLCSLANLRRELLSFDYTRYVPKHLTVEAIPVLSDGGSQDLVQLDGKESRRRLDTAER